MSDSSASESDLSCYSSCASSDSERSSSSEDTPRPAKRRRRELKKARTKPEKAAIHFASIDKNGVANFPNLEKEQKVGNFKKAPVVQVSKAARKKMALKNLRDADLRTIFAEVVSQLAAPEESPFQVEAESYAVFVLRSASKRTYVLLANRRACQEFLISAAESSKKGSSTGSGFAHRVFAQDEGLLKEAKRGKYVLKDVQSFCNLFTTKQPPPSKGEQPVVPNATASRSEQKKIELLTAINASLQALVQLQKKSPEKSRAAPSTKKARATTNSKGKKGEENQKQVPKPTKGAAKASKQAQQDGTPVPVGKKAEGQTCGVLADAILNL